MFNQVGKCNSKRLKNEAICISTGCTKWWNRNKLMILSDSDGLQSWHCILFRCIYYYRHQIPKSCVLKNVFSFLFSRKNNCKTYSIIHNSNTDHRHHKKNVKRALSSTTLNVISHFSYYNNINIHKFKVNQPAVIVCLHHLVHIFCVYCVTTDDV